YQTMVPTYGLAKILASTNARLEAGGTTLLLLIDDVDGPCDPYAPGRLYVVAPYTEPSLDGGADAGDGGGPAPRWDGTDVRLVDRESVHADAIELARVEFRHGYISGNVWVSGDPGETSPRTLRIPFSGQFFDVPVVRDAMLELQVSSTLLAV